MKTLHAAFRSKGACTGERTTPKGRSIRATTRNALSVAATLAALVLFALPWVSAATIDADSPDPLPPVVNSPYRIQLGDELQIAFFKTTQLNQTATVGPDGQIFLPLIGRVAVLDRTVEDVNSELVTRYDREIINPQITLSVSRYSGMLVYVGGEVRVPGVRTYRGGLTVVQAIMDAGGFETTARLKEVILIRRSPDGAPVGTIVNLKMILRGARFEQDILLAPADVIFVPRRKIANVNLFIEQYIANNIPIDLFYPLH